MAKNITIKIEAENIGPHIKLSNSFPMNTLRIGIFANTGMGKTFLSRLFRLIGKKDGLDSTNKLLTIGTNKGKFNFEIEKQTDNGKETKKLSIEVEKGNDPIITNDTGYIFHVFNSDYVKENIEELQYRPDGDIEGYILGKAKIDLSKEKDALEETKASISTKTEGFRNAVDAAKLELDRQKVNKGTKEYKFDYTNVYNGDLDYSEDKSFDDLKKLNSTLSRIPDDLKDIKQIAYNSKEDFFSGLEKLFLTEYLRSTIAEDFKNKVISKQDFIQLGLKELPEQLGENDQCPFCEQLLKSEAISLIDKYNEYLNDSEAKVNAEIKRLKILLTLLQKELSEDNSQFLKVKDKFDSVKKFLPTEKETDLTAPPNVNDLSSAFDNLNQFLERKMSNIDQVIKEIEFQSHTNLISEHLNELDENESNNNLKVERVNNKKNDVSSEKLYLNRRLCKATYLLLQEEQKEVIETIKELIREKRAREEEIANKESQEKVSKKEKVLESLKYYLECFFGDKYSLDEENYCLKFRKQILRDNATDVLSDGEKSIVAFCYYLADMHKVVSRDDDYDKLFFIIDDPISSLDFHYVYSVSQVIRSLHTNLGLQRTRFIIFTHNLEFMSILIRNKIINERLVLLNNDMVTLSRELVMPYEEHLRDIHQVTKSNRPTHTTPNSVRHVLETIGKFEAPNLDLREYCETKEVLSKNELIYSLVQDGSHGIIRKQIAYTDEMITKGCKVVIEFIRGKYEGQIKQIES